MNTEQARFNMIEQQIRPWDVHDGAVLQLLALVRREDFVPPALKNLAFVDMELPLLGGQYMLAPRVEARLLQELALHKHERVLEIGCGSGYMAALLAHKAQHVVSLEMLPDLVAMARSNLARAGVYNVDVREGNGALLPGATASALAPEERFDAVLLSGSVAELPSQMLSLLKPGGRLVAIVGEEPMMRATVVTQVDERAFRTAQPWDTLAPRLSHFAQPSLFRF